MNHRACCCIIILTVEPTHCRMARTSGIATEGDCKSASLTILLHHKLSHCHFSPLPSLKRFARLPTMLNSGTYSIKFKTLLKPLLAEIDLKCSFQILVDNASSVLLAIMQHLDHSSLFYVCGLNATVIIVNVKSIREQSDAVLNIVQWPYISELRI